jgi:hypothetical protein
MPMFFGMACGLLYGGLFAAIGSTALPGIALDRPRLLARLADSPRARIAVLGALYAGILYWGIVGAALGGLFVVMESAAPGGGLLVPNIAYAVVVATVGVMAGGALAAIVGRRARVQTLLLTAGFALIFAWLLPLLAA